MVKSVNYIILQLKSIHDQIILENAKYTVYLKANLRGKAQASQVHLKNLLKKRYKLYSELKAKLGGFALEVSYEYLKPSQNIPKKETAHFVNLSEEEAKGALTLGLLQKGYKIKILEIKKIPTFLSKGKL